jgi:hypothetical protein
MLVFIEYALLSFFLLSMSVALEQNNLPADLMPPPDDGLNMQLQFTTVECRSRRDLNKSLWAWLCRHWRSSVGKFAGW